MSTMWVRGICERFDHLIQLSSDPADRTHGYMEPQDRSACRAGPRAERLTPAISTLGARSYASPAELVAAVKRAANAIPGSISSTSVCATTRRCSQPPPVKLAPRGFALRGEFH